MGSWLLWARWALPGAFATWRSAAAWWMAHCLRERLVQYSCTAHRRARQDRRHVQYRKGGVLSLHPH